MKILVIGDIHADIENMLSLLDKVKEYEFDVIICPGDIIDTTVPKGFSSEEIVKIIIEELKTLKKPLFMVPGNMDGEILDTLEKEEVSLHEKGIKIGNYGFYGFGGARTPFDTSFEPSEEEILKGLNKGFEIVKDAKYKIQVTHMPPFNTKIDIIFSGAHVGSEVIRKFIEEKKPIAAISAHIHEAKGIDRINNTLLLNPGKFSEGYCGLVEIENSKVEGKIITLI